MAKHIKADALPHLHSTRDTRDRLDLVTDNVHIDATRLRADRIVYHPGDSAAPHYHTDCHHLFYILSGEGTLQVDEGSHRLVAGMVATVGPSEVHAFTNDSSENFSFVEFWSPPPTQTVWTTPDT